MKASVAYWTSPRVTDCKIVLETDVPSVVGGLVDLSEELTQPEIMAKVPKDWIQVTVTFIK